jgi:hypothetical protein
MVTHIAGQPHCSDDANSDEKSPRIAHFHNNPVIDYINLNSDAVKTKLNPSAASDKTRRNSDKLPKLLLQEYCISAEPCIVVS